ncbi:MAG TPA: glycosyltransferase [Firmicutes bacterium]|nr:glycosyltransferase [Bacillota bacterium]
MNVIYLTTYPPRKCGIAIFAADLIEALIARNGPGSTRVIAISDVAEYLYGPEVIAEISQTTRQDYVKAALLVNESGADLVHIQHEYGIFGGKFGSYLLDFLANVKKPVVVTLHTVQINPEREIVNVLREIARFSRVLIVMAEKARESLAKVYGIDPKKVTVIPHGVPNMRPMRREVLKSKYDLSGRKVISTLGLINPGKGIEYAIQALPAVVRKHPDVVYLVIGQTHPVVQRQMGETYRVSLYEMVGRLGLQDHVRFIDEFLTKDKLLEYLALTDIYLTPYISKEQITSGTLAYAVALGKAIVSTPYFYAEEMLAGGRGLLADFKDPGSIAGCILEILDTPGKQRELERKTRAFGRNMSWPSVAKLHEILFQNIMDKKVPLGTAAATVAAATILE